MNKSIFSKTTMALCVASTLLLTACGSEDQDKGTVSDSEIVFGGRAIDGYLSRSTVFLDTNNDGTRNAWEAFAFTDNDGYYSYNPLTDTNYCASDASPQEQQYCLVSNVDLRNSNVVVRVDGGYDLLTGEPFIGQMSRRVAVDEEANDVEDSLVSPLTSILTSSSGTERSNVLSALNIGEDDLDVDYLNTDGSGGIDANLLNKALKIHKTVAVLSDRLTDTYTEIGDEFGTPNDASSSLYGSLAQVISNTGESVDTALASNTVMTDVLDAAEQQLRAVYERRDLDLPQNLGSNFQNSKDRSIDNVIRLGSVIDSVIPVDIPTDELSEVGVARTIEALVIKSVNEGQSNDPSIDAMSDFLLNGNNDLITTLIGSLDREDADLSAIVNNNFTGEDLNTEQGIISAATLEEGTQPFTAVGGKALKVSDLDLGNIPVDANDAEVEVYFHGASSDISGSLSACVKYIEGANTNTGELGDGNTKGELITGFWSMLGATSDSQETFSLLLTIEFLGTTYQAIMKPSGNQTINNIDYSVVRFDFEGGLRNFHSQDWLQSDVEVPTSDAQCEERLPSRIGL